MIQISMIIIFHRKFPVCMTGRHQTLKNNLLLMKIVII